MYAVISGAERRRSRVLPPHALRPSAQGPVGYRGTGGSATHGGAGDAGHNAALDPAELHDFVLATAVREGAQCDNLARRVAVYAGYDALPGATVKRFCASSLQAHASAARAIRAGDGDAFLVGGVESTSSTPPVARSVYPGGEGATEHVDRILGDGSGWTDPREGGLVPDVYGAIGKTAELVARRTRTTREDQDA